MLSHFSMTTKLSGPTGVWMGPASGVSVAAKYSMQLEDSSGLVYVASGLTTAFAKQTDSKFSTTSASAWTTAARFH